MSRGARFPKDGDFRCGFGGFRCPDAAVVAERFGHEGELRLVIAGDGDAGRVDLGEARVGHQCATAGGAPCRHDITAHGVGGEEEDIAVAAGCQNNRIRRVAGDRAGIQIADNDALRVAIDLHEIEHLGARKHFHSALVDFLFQSLIAADQELLAGLAAGVEGAGNLRAAEGAVIQQPAVFAGEGHALRDALVDDLVGDLGEAIDVGLAGAEVAALDGVVEKAVNGVAVVAVVFRGVDAALRGDGVGAARRVLVAEAFHVVAQLGKAGRGGATREAGADHDDVEFPLVGRIDELRVHLVAHPFPLKRAGGDFTVECHGIGDWEMGGLNDSNAEGQIFQRAWRNGGFPLHEIANNDRALPHRNQMRQRSPPYGGGLRP